MQKRYDMIVIGGGPGGYGAALYGARAGLSVLVIEKMAPGGQMTTTGIIDNYPGFEEGIDGFLLGIKMQAGAERFGAQTKFGEVTGAHLNKDPKEITLGNEVILGSTVIIATGASPKTLGLDGEERLIGRGLHYCAHCDGRFYKGKSVLVVGGGNSALTDALYLSNLAATVHLTHRRDTFRAARIYQEAIARAKNVILHPNTVLRDLIVEDKVKGAFLKSTTDASEQALLCDGVFVSIGRKPSAEIFTGLNKDEYGYIVADESTKTNIPGVFAVGDVRTKPLRQVVTAVSDGAVAVQYAEEYLATQREDAPLDNAVQI